MLAEKNVNTQTNKQTSPQESCFISIDYVDEHQPFQPKMKPKTMILIIGPVANREINKKQQKKTLKSSIF